MPERFELPSHLGRLAHDLRGPLSPLQTAAYLLRRDDLDAERRQELVGIVERQTARLTAMIDELGEWIRAGQSRLVSRRETTELGLLLDMAVSSGSSIASAPAPAWQLEPGLDQVSIEGDPQRLSQMIAILIHYARHHADGGEPGLSGRREGDRVQLRIIGYGTLSEQACAVLFEAPDPSPFDDGLGLRLLIADAIAQAHGGQVSVDADAADGIEYLIELPLAGVDPGS